MVSFADGGVNIHPRVKTKESQLITIFYRGNKARFNNAAPYLVAINIDDLSPREIQRAAE
ncbi:hypothetical protein [Pectobacterium polaris]|uniref:hypothetical protein n=1 Tax=Pectobacterium polaris TaxID=2042057 RepID=UPI0032E3DB66